MPDEEWTGGYERKRDQPSDRAANPTRRAPDHDQPNETNDATEKPPCLEQRERRELGGECSEEVEAAAIHIEADEGERALVREAGRVKVYQEVAVPGVGIII